MKKDILPERYASTPALTAAYPGLNANTINSWVANQKVRVDPDGKRNERDCIALLVGNLNQEIERLKNQQGNGDNLRQEIDRAKLRKLNLENDLLELERDTKRGELISFSEALHDMQTAFLSARSKLLSLPFRLSLQLSGMSEPKAIAALLTSVIDESLESLAQDFSNADGDQA